MIMSRAEDSKENPGAAACGNINGVGGGHKRPLNSHYFSTFFWSKLKGQGYEGARLAKWTKKVRSPLDLSGCGTRSSATLAVRSTSSQKMSFSFPSTTTTLTGLPPLSTSGGNG